MNVAEAAVTAHGVPGGTEWMSDWELTGLSLISAERRTNQVGLSVKLGHPLVRPLLLVMGLLPHCGYLLPARAISF